MSPGAAEDRAASPPGASSSDEPELIGDQEAPAAPSGPSEPTPSSSSTGRFGALLGSASSLKKKASPFLSKAKQAIVEEAKLLTDDMRDVAGGVREGMELTKQDLKDHTRGWRSAFGAKLRSFQGPKEEGDEATAATESKEGKLQTLRQNLANTAKDVKELRQEVMDEVRLSVNDLRQVLRGPGPSADDDDKSPGLEAGDSGFNKVKASAASVFRKAGDLRDGLRNRFEETTGSASEADFWSLPSTQANYVQLNLPFKDPSEDRVARVKKLGGKLKGSLAKKGREVSDGVVNLAQDIRQRRQAKKDAANASKGPGEQQTSEDWKDMGDSIFAIGSDEEDWSDDGWEGTSDGAHSETPSTRSASVALAEAEAVHS